MLKNIRLFSCILIILFVLISAGLCIADNLIWDEGNWDETEWYNCPGDINCDGVVNMGDFSILSDNWGKTGKNIADLNGDEIVNMGDFSILSANWGKVCE